MLIASEAREPKALDFRIGASVCGKVFHRNGVTMAYLWPTGPWAAEVRLDLPAAAAARVYVGPEGVNSVAAGAQAPSPLARNNGAPWSGSNEMQSSATRRHRIIN